LNREVQQVCSAPMRLIACIALLLTLPVATSVGTTTVWKWRDANGVVHYSDQPVQGAEKVGVQSASTFSATPVTPSSSSTATAAPAVTADYKNVEIWKPGNGDTLANTDQVSVGVRVEPALQAGHRLALYLDGTLVQGFPPQGMEYQLTGVERGTHNLQLVVIDSQGKQVKSSAGVQFTVTQPSVLNPNNPNRQR